LVASAGEDGQQRWRALPTAPNPLLETVDLRGAHDFRHTFATWLEDAGIPARVIDEVMGHEATSRAGQHQGSAMGAHYRHTTPKMAARIATAIEQRLRLVLEVAEQALEAQPHRSAQRVFEGHGPRFLANLWQMALRAGVEVALCLVELRGFEPLTPCMPSTSRPLAPQHASTRPLTSVLLSAYMAMKRHDAGCDDEGLVAGGLLAALRFERLCWPG
jgi:hypothetical protein